MQSIFKISKRGKFGLLIEGLESDNSEYLLDLDVNLSHRSYTWEHSVTVNTLATLNASGDETFVSYHIVEHSEEECCDDRLEVQLKKDGLYRIAHIILPTKDWIQHSLDSYEAFNQYEKVYYYDKGKFYLLNITETIIDGEIISEEIDFETIYEEFPSDENTIIRSDKNTFVMYYLNNCFNNLLKTILNDFTKDHCVKTQEYNKRLIDRDIMWMFINVIKYSLESGDSKLYEAQRYLEKFNRCNIICDNNLKPTNNNGCGC